MGLEAATTIEGLDKTWPLGGDTVNKGDDHLRLLKAVLQAQFPGAAGNGFAITITAKETEINFLGGVTSNVQTQLNTNAAAIAVNAAAITTLQSTLPAPPGTVLPFFNAAPPTGWSQVTTHTDAMLRVVSTAGGGNGGSDSAILNNKVPSHTHATDSQGAHTHTVSITRGTEGANVYGSAGINAVYSTYVHTSSTSGAHTHTAQANAGAANWTPKYLDMIIASKD